MIKFGKQLFLFLIILTTISCNIFKKNINKKDNAFEKKILNIEKRVNSGILNFNTFSASFSGKYSDNKQIMPLKGLIKIEKNKFIWVTIRPFLGIEVARILLTDDSIKFINKINNQYFTEDYNYLKKQYGFSLNYNEIEAFFTNRIITFPSTEELKKYTILDNDTVITLQKESTILNQSYIHSLIIDKNYFLIENTLTQKDKLKQINLIYSNFTQVQTKYFPLKMIINAKNRNQNGRITIDYKNIKINTSVSAKFTIPKNYKRIRFE